MKQKLQNLKTKLTQNKKKSAIIGLALLLLIGVAGFGIAELNKPKNTPVAKTEKQEVKKDSVKADSDKKEKAAKSEKKTDTEKKVSDDKATTEKKAAEDKADQGNAKAEKKTEQKAAAKAEGKQEVTSSTQAAQPERQPANNSNSSNTGNNNKGENTQTTTPPAQTQQETPKHQHNYNVPVYKTEQVWVVDSAAWTETITEPVYEMVEKSICSTCGKDITGNVAPHVKAHALAGEATGGDYSEWVQEQTGTNTYTKEHPEEGHYKTESTLTGYKCSCGATQ